MMGLAGDDGAEASVEQLSLEGRRGGDSRVAEGGDLRVSAPVAGLTMGRIGSGNEF